MSQVDDTAEATLLDRLAGRGLRLTGPRRAIARLVVGRSGQFTADEVWDQVRGAGIGRATVFRTLDLLAELGVLSRVHVDGCHRYTVCDTSHHHHFVCRSCGLVAPIDASEIEREIRRLARRLDFQLDEHQLEFAGRCAACRAQGSGSSDGTEE